VDLHSRWKEAWRVLAAAPDPALFTALISAYSEPERHYHTLQHLEECFTRSEDLKHLARHPDEIELALWFHDAIHDTRRHDNEKRSAQWAAEVISPVSREAAKRVHGLVMATRHEAVPEGIDAQILVDVDLSILGAPEQRFDEYELQVRQEYAWVPQPLYRRERRKILAAFRSRASVFSTAKFVELYEAQARKNLERALARL
jgi:predicted metal-dependent HD superfamily phosphohydrolase